MPPLDYLFQTDAMCGSYRNPIDIRMKLDVCTHDIKSNQWRNEVYDAGMRLDSMTNIKSSCKLLA